MKIRISEPGWANYTGEFGMVNFVDGVSEDISKPDAQRLGAILSIECVEDGSNPSIAQVIIDKQHEQAAMATVPTAEEAPPAPAVSGKIYTSDELAALADKGGIKAIREIADPMGLTGTSVAQLLGKILQKQEAAAKAAAAAASAAEVSEQAAPAA